MKNYKHYIARKQHEFGDKFDSSELSHQFIPFYESGQRIEVSTPWGELERGYVGVTTGWCPCFLLIHRCSDFSSSTTLNDKYAIVKTLPLYLN